MILCALLECGYSQSDTGMLMNNILFSDCPRQLIVPLNRVLEALGKHKASYRGLVFLFSEKNRKTSP